LLRYLQNTAGDYFYLPHPVERGICPIAANWTDKNLPSPYDNHVFTITVTFNVILVVWRDSRWSPRFCVTSMNISVLCIIFAFEHSLICMQERRAVTEKPHDAVLKSEFTAASRGSPCDSTAYLSVITISIHLRWQISSKVLPSVRCSE